MAEGELCTAVADAVRDAGRVAMEVYAGAFAVEEKSDRSPVTEADLRIHDVLSERLPGISKHPVISEESADDPGAIVGEFWLVDPLDGTKEFVKRTGEFTVNVALVRDGTPVLGVVHAPAIGVTWYAGRAAGAYVVEPGRDARRLSPRVPAESPLRVAVSRDHLGANDRALLQALGEVDERPMGSSLKFCRVASGDADLYVRFGRTMEWDTAAAQCVVECAGGRVVDLQGHPLRYGKAGRDNPSFLCFADPALDRIVPVAARIGTR